MNKGMANFDINALADALEKQVKAVNEGNLARSEEMLIAQAHALDALFYSMAHRARPNLASNEMVHLEAAERYMKLAMRAQSQCRATLETLADIKNPSLVAFVKQANISAGHQQVNNGVAAPMGESRAEENQIPQNKVLEVRHVERLDTRTQSPASGVNQELETVDAIYGPADPKR